MKKGQQCSVCPGLGQGCLGRGRWKLLPMSVAWVAAEIMVPCAVLVELGRNKDFPRTPPDVFLEKGCQSRGM